MILLTGASGRTSGLVLQEFVKQRVRVRALVRDASVIPSLHHNPYVELVEGRLGEEATLQAALRDVDRALLISSPRGNMVHDQCAFIDAAKAAGVAHVVKLSGRETGLNFDAERFSGTRDHALIERHLECSGLQWTHLRPSQFMQVYLTEPPSIAKNQRLSRPMADSRVSPVDIQDVARVTFRVMTEPGHQGRAYSLTGPEALTMVEIAARISAAIGRRIRFQDIGAEEFIAAMEAEGAPPPMVELLSALYGERRKSRFSSVDLSIYQQLSIRPTSFAEFAQSHAAQWSSNG